MCKIGGGEGGTKGCCCTRDGVAGGVDTEAGVVAALVGEGNEGVAAVADDV